MPSSFTTNKLLEKPAYNSYVDDWNTPVNADMDDIDTAFGGTSLLNATALSGVIALSISEYRPPVIVVSGVLTASVNFQLPSGKGGTWTFYNNTTGLFTVTFSSAGGGTSVVIAQTASVIVACDGTNVAVANTYAAGSTTAVQYNSGGVLAGTANFVHDGTNVGIGITPPGSKLDVKGTLRLSGSTSGYVGLAPAAAAGSTTYLLPAADGSAGQFLSTNGSATLSWSSSSAGVSTFSAGSTGFTPSSPTSGAVTLAGTLNVANGGTGQTSYTNGQLLIGNTTGNTLSKTTLTAGSGVTVTNGAGTITIAATGLGGTVTSVATAGSVNGITLTGGTITSTGTVTLGGTLSGVSLTSQVSGTLPVANGGTGLTAAPTNGQLDIGNGSGFTRATLTQGSGVTITNASGAITISATGTGGTVTSVGGTGTVNGITLTGTVTSSGNLTLGGTLSGVSLTSQVTGTLPVANGGTGGTSQATAQSALGVPSTTGSGASGTWAINVTGNAATATNGITTGNIGSYAPGLTGSGASGTWGINITGNAATATNVAYSGLTGSVPTWNQNTTGNAATATTATTATSATTATTATNLSGGSVAATTITGTTIAASSSITAVGNITAYFSDDRLKTRMGYISGALAKVMSLKGFYYEANETAQALGYKPVREVGLSAQDVQAVLPEVIAPAPVDPQYLTLDYARLVPLLVEAIKEQQILINALSAKVNG